jgi:NADPH-dependent curcumin reductase CurA
MAATAPVVTLARRPTGYPTADDFALTEQPLPPLEPGMVSVAVQHLSLDPYLRMLIAGVYPVGGIDPGQAMVSEAVGVVRASRAGQLPEGTVVAGYLPWTTQAVVPAAGLRPVDFGGLPAHLALGVLGMPGLTAYAALERALLPTADDVVVVSGAAGAVGSVACQLIARSGATVVAIAGGAAKCGWLRDGAGIRHVINHWDEEPVAAIRARFPEGVSAYFDNVGGTLLSHMTRALRAPSRIVLCGSITDYNATQPTPGPDPMALILNRTRLLPIVVADHEDLRPAWIEAGRALIESGALKHIEDITVGLDQAGAAFACQMAGRTLGKALVQVG